MSNPIELDFSQEELAQLYELIERETRHAYDAVAEGVARATREFAERYADLPLPDGTKLVLHSPEWEEWAEELDNLSWIENFQVEGFDVMAYRKQQLLARLASSN